MRLDRTLARYLPRLCVGATSLFVVFLPIAWWVVPAPGRGWVLALIVLSMTVLVAAGWRASTRGIPAGRANAWLAGIAMGPIAVVNVAFAATGDPIQTVSVAVLIIGAGVVFLSWPWLITVILITLAGWTGALVSLGGAGGIGTLVGVMSSAVVLALLSHGLRMGAQSRIEGLLDTAEERRARLEAILAAWHESEARLDMVVSSAPVLLCVVNANGTIALAKGRAWEAAGIDSAALVGRSVSTVLPEDAFKRAVSGHEATDHFVLDGRTFDARWTPLKRNDEVTGALLMAIDVTERQLADEQQRIATARQQEIEKLEEMARFRSLLLNTASHELNTPLTPIRLQMHLLKNSAASLEPRQREAVVMLDRNFGRLAALVRDILDVGRMQSGELPIHPKRISLQRAVEDAAATFAPACAEKGQTLEVECASDIDLVADELRMGQVLGNLLSNACKFTPRGGTVRVTTARDGDTATIRVRDDGRGLSPAEMTRLFQAFGQAHDTARETYGGTGLGLYISRGIVERHGGKLTCTSDGLGHGATFTITLPVAVPAEEATP